MIPENEGYHSSFISNYKYSEYKLSDFINQIILRIIRN